MLDSITNKIGSRNYVKLFCRATIRRLWALDTPQHVLNHFLEVFGVCGIGRYSRKTQNCRGKTFAPIIARASGGRVQSS